MANWFECKARFDKTQPNGSVKRVNEPYLVDALSFTEAEARIIEELTPYISGDFSISAVKRTRITEIFRDDTGDKWYQAKLMFMQIDEKGNEKKSATFVLIQAKDLETAFNNLKEGMSGTAADFEIVSLSETPIMDVYGVKLDKFTAGEKK